MSSRTLINAAVFACAIAVTGTWPDALYAQWDDPHSTTRIIVKPKETEVFVDGYLVGIADDFDGVLQGLRLDPGPHEITLFLNGHRTVHQRLNLSAGASYKVRHTMVANAAGEAQETRPVPPRPRESRQAGLVGACLIACGLPLAARAQSASSQPAPASPAASQGPLIVERVHSGGLIAPDVRVTDVNSETATLVGAYGGWITDNTWLFGGGGYWLANRSDTLKMAYGGAVVGWLARADRPIGFGVRTLIGAGTATIGTTLGEIYDFDDDDGSRTSSSRSSRDGRVDVGRRLDSDTAVRLREEYFVAEPQANVLFNVTDRLRVNLGVGYRLIGGVGPANELLHGPSGSVSLEWGGGRSR